MFFKISLNAELGAAIRTPSDFATELISWLSLILFAKGLLRTGCCFPRYH